MKKVLLYIWQLPQNLLGLLTRLILPIDRLTYIDYREDADVFVSSKMTGGITLGKYIFFSPTYEKLEKHTKDWNHEYGHTIQSKYLGPLYLLVIGLPSLIWAGLYGPIIKPTKNGYYKFYTEALADKLGGVKR